MKLVKVLDSLKKVTVPELTQDYKKGDEFELESAVADKLVKAGLVTIVNNEQNDQLAAKELAAKELAAKELAAKELAAKELAAKELAAKELAEKELAEKELAEKELAEKETVTKVVEVRVLVFRDDLGAPNDVVPVAQSSVKELVAGGYIDPKKSAVAYAKTLPQNQAE